MADTSDRNTVLAWQILQIEIQCWHGRDFRCKYIAGMAKTSDCCLEELKLEIQYSCQRLQTVALKKFR
jgi:hypothetical protein